MIENRRRMMSVSLVLGVIVLAIIGLLTAILTSGGSPDESGAVVPPLATSTAGTPTPSPSPTPTAKPTTNVNTGLQQALGTAPGWGFSHSSTPHTLVMQIVSSKPIYIVLGWRAPTASTTSGKESLHQAGWSRTMSVYGNPNYAALYAQYAAGSGPVSCRIYVDGKLRVERTATGYYGQVFCLG